MVGACSGVSWRHVVVFVVHVVALVQYYGGEGAAPSGDVCLALDGPRLV